MPKRKAPVPPEDRAAEYIDTLLMTQRLRYGQQLSVRIDGNYGVYRTQLLLDRDMSGHCTCPSEEWPCKHLRALRATWKINPHSFFDLEHFLKELETRPKPSLVTAIAQIVMTSPETLGFLGVKGFELEEDELDSEDPTELDV